jgi:hypothetical protein
MNKIKIQYFKKSVYGNTFEYVADAGKAQILTKLTGQKTINGVTRELLRDLTAGQIEFVETFQPSL